ncbi:MAG: hypothetical protein AAGM38_17070 [Pseudomonadota bacterium]
MSFAAAFLCTTMLSAPLGLEGVEAQEADQAGLVIELTQYRPPPRITPRFNKAAQNSIKGRFNKKAKPPKKPKKDGDDGDDDDDGGDPPPAPAHKPPWRFEPPGM